MACATPEEAARAGIPASYVRVVGVVVRGDDAIVATNPLEMKFFLERNGCLVETLSCTDRHVAAPLDFLLNATPLRHLMFNAFVVARKNRK